MIAEKQVPPGGIFKILYTLLIGIGIDLYGIDTSYLIMI
jgi:hypothetical protein